MIDGESVGARHDVPLQERLERYYQANHSEAIQISDFKSISDGWETEVYSFTATLNRQVERLIVRMYPGENAGDKMMREYNGMFCLEVFGHYPVPTVMDHVTDANWLGKPFLIMQKIEGRPLGTIMRENPARFPERVTRFAQLLVALHHVDYRSFLWMEAAEMQAHPSDFLRLRLAFARSLIVEQLGQTWAVAPLDWLEARSREAAAAQLAVLHGDFHPWNILVTADEQAYVIDWSNVEVGDYRYDLAWTLLLSATQGSQQERDLFLSEYERLSGHSVEQIEYFEVIACVRRLLGLAVALGIGSEALGMRAESAAMMRSQGERFRRVYAILQRHTGLRLPEIERLLTTLAG